MDGARLWECQPYYNRPYAEIASLFDSVYVSFYKVLGGLPGAMLAGPAEFVAESRIWLRRHGGNLYTLAPNAIAAKVGMDQHLPKIADYVRHAGELAAAISGISGLTVVPECPPTNMMHLHLRGDKDAMEDELWKVARDEGVLLFRSLMPTDEPGKWSVELSITESALEVSPGEVRDFLSRILASG
jgi:threonine aldolase